MNNNEQETLLLFEKLKIKTMEKNKPTAGNMMYPEEVKKHCRKLTGGSLNDLMKEHESKSAPSICSENIERRLKAIFYAMPLTVKKQIPASSSYREYYNPDGSIMSAEDWLLKKTWDGDRINVDDVIFYSALLRIDLEKKMAGLNSKSLISHYHKWPKVSKANLENLAACVGAEHIIRSIKAFKETIDYTCNCPAHMEYETSQCQHCRMLDTFIRKVYGVDKE